MSEDAFIKPFSILDVMAHSAAAMAFLTLNPFYVLYFLPLEASNIFSWQSGIP